MSLAGGSAFLEIETTVTDTAGHKETASERLVVSRQPINVHVFAESGDAVPGVENILYILTAYPDGRPAICQVSVNGRIVDTDETGVAVIRTTPQVDGLTLDIEARDQAGNFAAVVEEVNPAGGYQDFLLRTDRAVYSGGQTINVTVLSAVPKATFFLDVIKDRQTMLTKTVPVERGQGTLAIDLAPDVFGTLKLNAYMITSEPRKSVSRSRTAKEGQPRLL
jgi:hypothetical protein